MEISKAISFITEDPRWQQKLMIGTGVIIGSTVLSVVFIGIIGFIIFAGYCVRLLQNVRDGQPYPLPEWDQWGEDLARGFKLVIAFLVWSLPMLVLIIPSIIGSAMTESRSDGAQFMGSMLLICGSCLNMIYGLLLAAVTPGISIAFAKDEQITSALQFRQILAWTQENIGQVLVVTLVYIAASIALALVGSIVGVLLCVVGLIITIPLATLLTSLFQYHLSGQLAYNFPYPGGGSTIDPQLTSYTPPTEMAPGVSPLVPPVSDTTISGTTISDTTVGTDTPVGDTTDYPDSGVDNPAPPPAA
ncbi:MAG: DUF4013 domain-containing protein [Caldilineaceae bacterium]|nr:DUF4013 domain-containing protein [Caldilineaceae bacterium]